MTSEEENHFEAKLAVAKVEKVFEKEAKKIQDHHIVITFSAKPPDKGNTDTTYKGLVDLGLIFELWMQQ